MSDKKRIVMLVDSKSFGGIESHIVQLSQGLLRYGRSVEVCRLQDHGPHPLSDSLAQLAIPFVQLDGRMSSLVRYLRAQPIALVHTHGYRAGIMGRLACRLIGTRAISTFHAGESVTGKLWLYDLLDRYSAWLAHHRFAVSAHIAKRLPFGAQVLNNFVDVEAIAPSQGQQIAFVGRLSYEKGPDRLLSFAHQCPQLTFHCYGGGPLQFSLQQTAQDQQLSNLIFYGQQDQMHTLWPQIGVLLLPSRNEGLPMAALEAMARGIVVIAFNVGALSSLIKHQQNGYLLTADQPQAMINALEHWQQLSAEQQQHMRHAARTTIAEQFATDKVLPKLLQAYGH